MTAVFVEAVETVRQCGDYPVP